jgi:hypothetical protein
VRNVPNSVGNMAQQALIDAIEAEFCLSASDMAYYKQYLGDPVSFIEHELGDVLTTEQKQICESLIHNRETNVQASHGCGKTHLSSRLALYWVLVVGGLCITTAPTKRQVVELLWGEIRKAHGKLKLPGELGQTFLRITETARAYGFTASDTNSNAFQGIHHDYLLVMEDEACGISSDIDEGAESCATGENNRFLRVGNPIEVGGAFEKACKSSHIRIPVWNHPNVAWAYELNPDGMHRLQPAVAAAIGLDPEKGTVLPQSRWPDWCPSDAIPGAVSIAWIEKVRAKYGEGSAYWQSRVEGFFPEDAAQSIIPRSYFLAARARYDEDPAYWDRQAAKHPCRFGLDVGDGGDSHALARWRGMVLYGVKEYPTKGDRMDVGRAEAIARNALEAYGGTVIVDRNGCGSGALSGLLEDGLSAVGVHWGEAAQEPALYLNSKAEDWWLLRESFRLGEIAIAPLGDDEEMLMEDLSGVNYEQQSNGKIRIEDKAKTKKRLKRSPNTGDAVVIGFRQPVIDQWAVSEVSWG